MSAVESMFPNLFRWHVLQAHSQEGTNSDMHWLSMLQELVDLGSACLSHDPYERPTFEAIVEHLASFLRRYV